jgi:ATPase subunit of ABC transporter with duplicated ATPase domains
LTAPAFWENEEKKKKRKKAEEDKKEENKKLKEATKKEKAEAKKRKKEETAQKTQIRKLITQAKKMPIKDDDVSNQCLVCRSSQANWKEIGIEDTKYSWKDCKTCGEWFCFACARGNITNHRENCRKESKKRKRK